MTPASDGLSRLELVWRQRAQQNLQRWGLQETAPLVLAMAEEVGEMADAFELDVIPRDDRGAELLVELRDLAFEIRDYLEDVAEDDDGNPLPPAERDSIDVLLNHPEELIAELDDLMPLGYQLQSRVLADYGDLRAWQQRPPQCENHPDVDAVIRYEDGSAYCQECHEANLDASEEYQLQDDEEPENPWEELDGESEAA